MSLMGLIAIAIVVIIMLIVIIASINFVMNENMKEKAAEEEKNKPTTPDKMNEKDKEAYKKEKQDNKWSDPNEHAKYVIMGGKIECSFCSPTFADIIVTSTTVKLQDKPWVTVDDKDGKKNFNFTGVCKHPSQQKPGSPPPPCKTVISLGAWKNFSKTLIDGKNAIVVESTLPCMISGQDLKIKDSGQKATLTKIEPDRKESKIHVTLESIDTEHFTPLGIQNPVNKNIKTSGYFSIKYKITGEDATSIRFSVFTKYGNLVGFASLANLQEVVVTGQKTGNKADKKATHSIVMENRIIEDKHLKQGSHVIKWDGFSDEGVLDTANLLGSLRFQVSVVGSDGSISVVSAKEVTTEKIEPAAKWVKAVITNTVSTKNIDVSININLVDGGEKGLSCSTYHYTTGGSPTVGAPGEYHSGTVCDWDKIPASAINPVNPVIKSRTRSFDDLVNMVLKGMKIYWSRNGSRDNGITVNNVNFTVNTLAENTTKKPPYSLDDMPLIYNTNGDWGRSGNPGGSSYGLGIAKVVKGIDAIINMIQQTTYSVGYLRYSSGRWGYETDKDADDEFTETSAHELGHEILQAFGGDIYSYQHKGSSYLTQETKPTTPDNKKWYDKTLAENIWDWSKDQMKDVKGENAPSTGEQDLMKYYHGGKAFGRIVAAEEDLKGLIWLTSIKISK